MTRWDDVKNYLLFYAKDGSIIKRRDIRTQLNDAVEAGDELQDKNRELEAHLSAEQVLAKRWEKFIELMGDDSYTELTPEEYVSQLDNREQKLEEIQTFAEKWANAPSDPHADAFSDPPLNFRLTRKHGEVLKAILSQQLRKDQNE